jgi:hypothetical protein
MISNVIDGVLESNFEIVFSVNSLGLFNNSTYKKRYWSLLTLEFKPNRNSIGSICLLRLLAAAVLILTSKIKPISGELRELNL